MHYKEIPLLLLVAAAGGIMTDTKQTTRQVPPWSL